MDFRASPLHAAVLVEIQCTELHPHSITAEDGNVQDSQEVQIPMTTGTPGGLHTCAIKGATYLA